MEVTHIFDNFTNSTDTPVWNGTTLVDHSQLTVNSLSGGGNNLHDFDFQGSGTYTPSGSDVDINFGGGISQHGSFTGGNVGGGFTVHPTLNTDLSIYGSHSFPSGGNSIGVSFGFDF